MANYLLNNGDLVEVALRFRYGVQGALIIRHYVYGAHTTGASNIHHAAVAVSNHFEAQLTPLLNDRARFLGTWARRLRPTAGVTDWHSLSPQAEGEVEGDALPRQICGLITLRTNVPGPRGRGRAYIPFPAESDNNMEAMPSSNYVTHLTTLATKFSATISPIHAGDDTGELVPVIFSRKFNAAAPINGISVRTRWATQRRRGDFGAPNLYI